MKRFITIGSVVLLIVLSCSVAQARNPGWIDGTSSKYPEPRFFIGVGTATLDKGGKRQQMEWAGDRARAEIAKTLRTEVRVVTRAERTVESERTGRRTKVSGVSKQSDVVVATANELLEGVEVKEYYRDKRGKMLYALAVLDRVKAARRLEDKGKRLKADVFTEMDAGGVRQKEGRPLAAIGHYQKALDGSHEVVDLAELIGILKPTGPSPFHDAPTWEGDIKRILYGLKRSIGFSVEVAGPAAKVKNYMTQGLAKAGYVTTKGTGGKKLYRLVGTTDLTHRGQMKIDPTLIVQIYQADLDVEVQDASNGETVGTLTWSVSMNEQEAEMAKKSAVRALGRQVQSQIAAKLANLL